MEVFTFRSQIILIGVSKGLIIICYQVLGNSTETNVYFGIESNYGKVINRRDVNNPRGSLSQARSQKSDGCGLKSKRKRIISHKIYVEGT